MAGARVKQVAPRQAMTTVPAHPPNPANRPATKAAMAMRSRA
jgi:hypothetical protein